MPQRPRCGGIHNALKQVRRILLYIGMKIVAVGRVVTPATAHWVWRKDLLSIAKGFWKDSRLTEYRKVARAWQPRRNEVISFMQWPEVMELQTTVDVAWRCVIVSWLSR